LFRIDEVGFTVKVLFSNLGYATGINGALLQHVARSYRHVFQPMKLQRAVLSQFMEVVEREKPDLCCLIELDRGSMHSGFFNQMDALLSDAYHFHDVADKYGPGSRLSQLPFHAGKSSGILASTSFEFEYRHFVHGAKRLIYHVKLASDLTLLFTHFSLNAKTRQKQFGEMREMIDSLTGNVIILADFNTLNGLRELGPLLSRGDLELMNSPDEPTFTFHRWHHVLDLCLCSRSIRPDLSLKVISQPFSDHDALLVTVAE
jgi:endonuclease/exonuclease/phosphatase family metal-dependent hydrolase